MEESINPSDSRVSPVPSLGIVFYLTIKHQFNVDFVGIVAPLAAAPPQNIDDELLPEHIQAVSHSLVTLQPSIHPPGRSNATSIAFFEPKMSFFVLETPFELYLLAVSFGFDVWSVMRLVSRPGRFREGDFKLCC